MNNEAFQEFVQNRASSIKSKMAREAVQAEFARKRKRLRNDDDIDSDDSAESKNRKHSRQQRKQQQKQQSKPKATDGTTTSSKYRDRARERRDGTIPLEPEDAQDALEAEEEKKVTRQHAESNHSENSDATCFVQTKEEAIDFLARATSSATSVKLQSGLGRELLHFLVEQYLPFEPKDQHRTRPVTAVARSNYLFSTHAHPRDALTSWYLPQQQTSSLSRHRPTVASPVPTALLEQMERLYRMQQQRHEQQKQPKTTTVTKKEVNVPISKKHHNATEDTGVTTNQDKVEKDEDDDDDDDIFGNIDNEYDPTSGSTVKQNEDTPGSSIFAMDKSKTDSPDVPPATSDVWTARSGSPDLSDTEQFTSTRLTGLTHVDGYEEDGNDGNDDDDDNDDENENDKKEKDKKSGSAVIKRKRGRKKKRPNL